jgi:hypothetical protein
VLFIYITRLASNEIFSPSNKIHREVGRAKELPAPRYLIIRMFFIVIYCVVYLITLSVTEAIDLQHGMICILTTGR